MAATLLKTPRRRETGKISMFLKCSTAMENKTVFCPIPQGFPEGGETPARGATTSSASRWCLHHKARHPSPPKPHKKEEPPSSASAAPGEPRREQAAVARAPPGRQGGRKGQFTLWLTTVPGRVQTFDCEEAKHWDFVGDKKRQKGQLCSKIPSSWL